MIHIIYIYTNIYIYIYIYCIHKTIWYLHLKQQKGGVMVRACAAKRSVCNLLIANRSGHQSKKGLSDEALPALAACARTGQRDYF